MSRVLLILAGGGGFFLLVYAIGSWIFASRLIAQTFAPANPADFAGAGLPEPEVVSIPGEGVTLAGWFFANPRREGCAVVMLHGFGATRSDILGLTPLFWDRGCDLLLYDARGHGESSPAFPTFGQWERRDLLWAVAWLGKRTGLPIERIGLAGWSYGGATAIQAAPDAPGIAFVLSDSSFVSLEAIATEQAEAQYGSWAKVFLPGALWVASQRASFDAWNASPERAMERAEVPVLIVHSLEDDYIPVRHAQQIYAQGDPSRTELVMPDWPAGHVGAQANNPSGYAAFLDRFLDRFAPGFGRRLASQAAARETWVTANERQ